MNANRFPQNPHAPQPAPQNNPGGARGDMPKPPKVGRPDGLAPSLKGAPEDVRFGVWAWLSVSAMQVLDGVVQFVGNLTDDRALRGQVAQQLKDDAFAKDVMEKNNLSMDSMVGMLNLSMTAITVLAAALCAFLTWRAGRGGNYSRMFLNVGSFYLAINALLLLFSKAPETLPLGFVVISGILTILSGVVAIVGVYFFSRPGNGTWLGWPTSEELRQYADALEKKQREDRKNRERAKNNNRAKAKDKPEKSSKSDKPSVNSRGK
ncbi:hypothetical protein [Corynebacterium auriscanis]|nr:hypothetical protein [Corynebacterium auriscanis]WJY73635.1 hypothetical protein CAURIC_10180 [Corynebacterium auriscanis]